MRAVKQSYYLSSQKLISQFVFSSVWRILRLPTLPPFPFPLLLLSLELPLEEEELSLELPLVEEELSLELPLEEEELSLELSSDVDGYVWVKKSPKLPISVAEVKLLSTYMISDYVLGLSFTFKAVEHFGFPAV